MAYSRGRCTNFDYCPLADARRDVEVPIGQGFLCPECGKPLRAPPLRANSTGLAVAAMIGLGALTLLAGALYLGLRLGERVRDRQIPAAQPPIATSPPPSPHAASGLGSGAEAATGADRLAASSVAPPRPPPPADTVLLRLMGSPDLAESLAGSLASAFLSQAGDAGVTSLPNAVHEIRVSGVRAGHTESILVISRPAADGFKALAAGAADIALAARPILPGEGASPATAGAAAPPTAQIVALDALAVVTHSANNLASLRLDQVRDVFSGRLTDWSSVGGPPGPIHAYIDRAADHRDNFADAIGGEDAAGAVRVVPDAAAVAQSVLADPQGIGLVDLPHIGPLHTVAIADGGVPVSPISPAAVALGEYPLAYRLYMYHSGLATDPLVQRFAEFVVSPAGQKIVVNAGLVPPAQMPADEPPSPLASSGLRRFIGPGRRLDVQIHFDPNSKTPTDASQRVIARLAETLLANHLTGDRLVVAGFSDKNPRPSISLAVSRDRASEVAMRLARAGLAPARVDGFGNELPVAENVTEAGRARNRRVEIYVLPK